MNAPSREIVFKIVYYGPGLGGKTTTLEHLHATTKPEHRGKLVSLATPVDRTLYFDFLPMRLPPVRGMNVRLQLFTVPGQVYFNATRKLVLTGADGIVFVSDSQAARADANIESLENLRENLAEQGRDLAKVPLVFQHNKRDLPDLLPMAELDGILNPLGAPSIPTSARSGMGIYEGLEKITEEVLRAFSSKLPEAPGEARASFSAIEGGMMAGLMSAIREASPSSDSEDIVVARIADPQDHEAFGVPSDTGDGDPMTTPAATLFSGDTAPARESRIEAQSQARAAPDAAPTPEAVPVPIAVVEAAREAGTARDAGAARDARPAREAVSTREAGTVRGAGPAREAVPAREAGSAREAVPAREAGIAREAVPTREAGTGREAETIPAPAAPATRGFSFADLWPEAEQETVRDVEAALGAQENARAVELCEALVARVLASAAGLFGTAEAPRDPALIPILLGLHGARYLAFRATVREARAGTALTSREALAAFAFAIDARLARSSIR